MQLVAIMDDIACGLAPVTTTIQGPMELVRDRDNGILVYPPDNLTLYETALSQKIGSK